MPFLNDFVRLADEPAMDKIADELKDRVLLSMARLMQHHDRLGSSSIIISAVASASSSSRRDSLFFPASTPWPTPVVRDALFALKEMAKVAAPIVRKNVSARPPAGQFERSCRVLYARCEGPLRRLRKRSGDSLYHIQGRRRHRDARLRADSRLDCGQA